MEFYNNKNNDILKFKINSQGVAKSTISARLVFLTNENKNYLFNGQINDDICEFKIPELQLYESGNNGKVVFEIVTGDTYFKVWESKFNIKSKASIIVQDVIEEHVEEVKEEIQAQFISVDKEEKPEKLKKAKKRKVTKVNEEEKAKKKKQKHETIIEEQEDISELIFNDDEDDGDDILIEQDQNNRVSSFRDFINK